MSVNQDLMIRLFRSIDPGHDDDLVKVAKKIIESEKKKGHSKMADRLAGILDAKIVTRTDFKNGLKTLFPAGTVIPTDKRYNIPLATRVSNESLRHDMILPKEIEAHIQRIEKEYAARERLAHHGLQPRRKILFYGAPGCGKSMSAERIAWNIGLPFLKVRFEAVMSSYLGESASNLKQLFESIKDYPCVLLLDEFDFIAKARSTGQDVGEMHRMVNILLNLLEDYDAPGLLIATTNLESTLDKALFRRFDDIIEIPRPGEAEIARLLTQTLSSMTTDKKINWKTLAKKMNGFSAALVVKVANDAAKMAVIGGAGRIEEAHLQRSLDENLQYNK